MMTAPTPTPRHTVASLLQALDTTVAPDDDVVVSGLCADSRHAQPGDLFLACAGHRVHGLAFVDQALAAGVAAIAWEPPAPASLRRSAQTRAREAGVPLVAVEGLGRRAGLIAARFFDDPSEALWVVGVTGTDGKTSCTHYLAQAFDRAGRDCGLIGTLGAGRYGDLQPGVHTTPDPVTLQRVLAELRDGGASTVAMEVSSHALAQDRVSGTAFDVAVLTNLSRDHLDYHADEADYAAAKRRLFGWPGLAAAVVNLDDPFAAACLAARPEGAHALGYRLADGPNQDHGDHRDVATVLGDRLRLDADGLAMAVRTPWGDGEVRTRLVGRFNAYNVLAVTAALLVSDVELGSALAAVQDLANVAGRMERFGGGERPLVVVDYAHTPRSLEQVLTALRAHTAGRLWCVFGCGGERDPGKRPLMGAVAERHADRLVITDDNPRGEAPEAITAEITAGLRHPEAAHVVHDRVAAIAEVLRQAAPGDVVLVAGKGHEPYQEVAGERLPYSDREQVRAWLEEERP